MLPGLLLLLLALSGTTVAATNVADHAHRNELDHYLSFEFAQHLVDILVEETATLFQDMASVNTLCAVGQERARIIGDKYSGFFGTKNRQQDELAALFQAQVKEIEHNLQRNLQLSALSVQAASTLTELEDLQAEINDQYSLNLDQQTQIENITQLVSEIKEEILELLEANLTELEETVNDTREGIFAVSSFVQSRKCEYGTVTVWPGDVANVTFKTLFDETPSVSLSLTGFSAHLEGHSYDYNTLAFGKPCIDNANADGFSVQVEDGSGGIVHLTQLTYSFMACQHLDEGLPAVE